ncbi:hypothetical protein GCM10010472_07390 [Pseudonocardia halophobica]|uniref:Uncharacterized protein n=1 Tax=Pseudonocardia halophobica TaxID=29401 RepID=A0A9W6NZ88_9PSEU|nr:hypothetical protein [Pseudonocardia halophobica]GLL14744.1 hypothetical protein GCM10017577_58920 [Pseudonocardia halophobica]
MKLSRTLLATAVALLGAFAFTGTAQAAEVTTFHLQGRNTAGDNGYCSFPVTILYTSNQKLRPGPNGLVTGNATAKVTNDISGKTLTYNVSGPSRTTINSDGTLTAVAGGPNLLFTTVANSYPGVPQLAYSTGRVQFTLTPPAAPGSPPEGNFGRTTSYSLSGSRTDVCAALA